MKKILVFTLVLLTVSVSTHAMTVSQEWEKVFTLGFIDIPQSVKQTIDGGYIVTGHTHLSGQQKFVIKLDYNGNISWLKTYGRTNYTPSILQTSDGNYILADYDKVDPYESGGKLIKLNSNGDVLWEKTYWEENKGGSFHSIQQTTDGGFIAAGLREGDLWILKLDSVGDISWQKAYGGNGWEGPTVSGKAYHIQQTSDGGYILAVETDSFGAGGSDIWVLKLDNSGNIDFQKVYGGYASDGQAFIKERSDGGYIMAGTTFSFGAGEADIWVIKLDDNGAIIWQKTYGGSSFENAGDVQETIGGDYIIAGNLDSSGNRNLLNLKLSASGEIVWQKVYTEHFSGFLPKLEKTQDGGFIVATNSSSTSADYDLWLIKLNSEGDIPGCDMIVPSEVTVNETFIEGQITSDVPRLTNASVIDTIFITIATERSTDVSTICQYDNPNDTDGDGIEDTPGGTMASSMFLAGADNCPEMPNGPQLGTCTQGNVGSTCISDAACGVGGVCSMAQEDSFPPGGNGVGDACDCECDFDCSGGVDANDVTAFLGDFGRSTFFNPCTNASPCSGDVDCNGSCDANDVNMFLEDFGRSQFNNPCPPCVAGDWCVYP